MGVQAPLDAVAVIGAGVIGCAIAYALAREGRQVILIDRDEPGRAGASFGNVGHIAAELVEPLPSPQLLFGFWRELSAFGGPLSIQAGHFRQFAPWARRFAAAAFRRDENTRHLAPLVKPASAAFERMLRDIGQPQLLRRNGHYQIWLGKAAQKNRLTEARHMARLKIPTEDVPVDLSSSVRAAARTETIDGLWFPESAHVVDPFLVCKALAAAAIEHGAVVRRAHVLAVRPRGQQIEVSMEGGHLIVAAAVVCAGVWSGPLLAEFGLRVPMEGARGYHVELAGHAPHVDAPIIYMDHRILVTPMAGRLRASGFMEFAAPDAEPDDRKPAKLRRDLQGLGYSCEGSGPFWVGARPVLPDYLPGIGRAPGPCNLFYAVGHQHLGLTLAPVTAELMAELVGGRATRVPLTPFDLRRFSGKAFGPAPQMSEP